MCSRTIQLLRLRESPHRGRPERYEVVERRCPDRIFTYPHAQYPRTRMPSIRNTESAARIARGAPNGAARQRVGSGGVSALYCWGCAATAGIAQSQTPGCRSKSVAWAQQDLMRPGWVAAALKPVAGLASAPIGSTIKIE